MDTRAIETYNAAYNRAARVRNELREGLALLKLTVNGKLPTADELERLAHLRRELGTLDAILDVDVLS